MRAAAPLCPVVNPRELRAGPFLGRQIEDRIRRTPSYESGHECDSPDHQEHNSRGPRPGDPGRVPERDGREHPDYAIPPAFVHKRHGEPPYLLWNYVPEGAIAVPRAFDVFTPLAYSRAPRPLPGGSDISPTRSQPAGRSCEEFRQHGKISTLSVKI